MMEPLYEIYTKPHEHEHEHTNNFVCSANNLLNNSSISLLNSSLISLSNSSLYCYASVDTSLHIFLMNNN